MNELTDKQKQVLSFIISFQDKNRYIPSVREICKGIGVTSSSTVHDYLQRMEEKGYIRRLPGSQRAMDILKTPEGEPFSRDSLVPDDFTYPANMPELTMVPIVGRVTAGEPILAVENIEDYFPLPVDLAHNSEVFMLHVRGESMINAGIFDGDLILVRKQNTASNGDYVVALLGDSVTVKTFYKEATHIRLQPENDSMAPILVMDCQILGKVIGLYRKL